MHKTNCPVFKTTDLIGKKWTLAILQEIALHDSKGFNHLFKRLNTITPKILSKRLKELEQHNIITKEMLNSNKPTKTRYYLTQKGKDLYTLVQHIKHWNVTYGAAPQDCPSRECVACPLF